MMYWYYGDPIYIVFIVISLAVTFYAQIKVKNAFNKYSKIRSSNGLTGAEAAKKVLEHNDVIGVGINRTSGSFSDYYDSRTKGVYLSESVYAKPTLAAVGVAAHECGHATQDDVGYWPIRLRQMLVPITTTSSRLAMPLVLIGLFLPTKYQFVINLGIILFSVAVLFELVTLPVEFDASRRALKALKEVGMLEPEEIKGARKVLSAAAMTYLASAFTSLLSLIRLILIARSRRD
ncbi:MAG: zinc metallopeptidase [Clostridia bacterium]|nr:zinc metallopeptidase [Clostridia bacterium]